ncbi:CHAT domain-containing protein [Bradyrhizobium sp.]|uniref:CHAT domain-containing protein n=1 Tax=Bradyrhizobium sp. TaxID=376 RepID=UPI000AA2D5F0|nr:CHAT domain-containing protein [Bradyrhizobium sp.]
MSRVVISEHLPKTTIAGSWKTYVGAFSTACCIAVVPDLAMALSMEQAIASCRETVGRPIVQACMGGRGRAPDAEQLREACRAKASPGVRACVVAAMNKANGRANVAIAIDDGKTKKEAIDLGNALPAGFVPPPRTIADITAVLDDEKPDPAMLAKLKDEAEDEPEKGLSVSDLAEFYYDRGAARAALGRNADAISDGEKALAIVGNGGDAMLKQRIRGFVALQKQAAGDLKTALEMFQQMIRETQNVRGMGGHIFGASRNIMPALILSGDIAQAEGYLRRMQTYLTDVRTSGIPGKREAYNLRGRGWEADFESGRATILEARGQYREAEASYRKAADYRKAFIADLKKIEYGPKEAQVLQAADADLLNAARMKAKQGRLAEAEVDARSVLLSRLKARGKYHPATTRYVTGLAGVLIEQGRYADAEKLIRSALDIQRTVGIADNSQVSAQILSQLGSVLAFQRKSNEAASVYAELDKAIAKWEPGRKQVLELNGSRISTLYASGQIEAGIAAAQELLKREVGRVGEKHFDTAAARGTLAVGLGLAGKEADATREFKAAIPVLMAASRENADNDDDTVSAARSQRLQNIVEAYIAMLAKNNDNATGEVSLETFALADSIRGQSVQRALSASSARSVAKDPALAELVRKEQDLGKQINAQLGALNNALSSNARDEKVVKATNASIDRLRSDRDKVRQEINRKFPSYAELIDPKPPSVEQIKATLTPGEAMLSFYFGRRGSFVWAVPKEGPVTFAAVKLPAGEIESKVRKLREALEPNAAMISDIPAFDVALGYELYSLLLKPVEAGWKSAKSLIVVTNGALGLLPLPLLPTAPAEIKANDEPLFASYRKVPWLARTHAVTMVPSSAALRTLRQLPPGKPERGELIAFGDPYFSKEQAAEADLPAPVQVADASGVMTRGVPLKRRNSPRLEGVDSAELALLPRLPDTAEELRSIALALQADPAKVLHLGKDANEKAVKAMDLSGFKVLAFATHGLVPGELNGLTQPALALSAPALSGSDGDGLLTMSEILSMKLDADWVVLSACNTGAGAGAGAEAASGLGRAFFYAGTRALLVTNWSVHSQSARELVTDLFKRQANDKNLTRGEALRQAMMAMVDGPGYADAAGKTEFAYAHPLFWAPYTIIGDGGKR